MGRPAPSRRAEAGRRRPRRPALWAAAFLLLSILGAIWYLRDRSPDVARVANLGAPGELVVFFGDSITQGYGVPPGEAFPALVAASLGVPFLNAGVPGDTTAAGLARLERDVVSHAPRLTVVELGGNDFLRRVPVEETIQNLEAIVARLVSAGTMVVLLEVNVGLGRDAYLAAYRRVAERHGALLVEDILRGILTDPSLRLDPIHPNARGHRRIADRVIGALGPLLREAERRRNMRSKADFLLPDPTALDTLES